MDASNNTFAVLSYVSGPALLTNATSLLLLSTSNRFGRAIDRSRELVKYLEKGGGARSRHDAAEELVYAQRRVQLIGGAMARFYLSLAMFALATMLSIAAAVLDQFRLMLVFDGVITSAAISGLIGFIALVSGSTLLMRESRLAVRSLKGEAAEVMEEIDRALHEDEKPAES